MATLNPPSNVSGRIEAGDAVIAAASTVDTRPVKAKFNAFVSVHGEYVKLQAAVARAEEALSAQRALVAEADADLDDAIDLLANDVVGDGLDRKQPFKSFGAVAPSKLQSLGYEAEAVAVEALVKKLTASAKISPATKKRAKSVGTLANALKKAVTAAQKLAAPYQRALAQRDALEQRWATALSVLRRAAKSVADDGHPQVFDALFRSTVKKPAAKKKAAKPPAV